MKNIQYKSIRIIMAYMVEEIVCDIDSQLEDLQRKRKLTIDEVFNIKSKINNVQDNYEERITELTHKMDVISTKHKKEIDDLSEKHKQICDDFVRSINISLQKEKQIRIRNDLIWRGKILVRQLENDRFYNIAIANKDYLDKIDSNELIKNLKRQNTITIHIGVKLAMSILCDKITINGISKKLCIKYIDDNDEMHPKCKPFKDVLLDLELFASIVSSLDTEEQKKYNVEPDIIAEEIELFKKTEK